MKVEPIVEWDLSGAGRDDLDQEEMPDKVTKKKEKKSGPKAAKREEALAAKKQIKVEVEEEEEDEGKKYGPQRSVKENASPIDQEHSKDEDASNDDRGADQFSQEHQLTDEVVDEIEMIGIPEDEFVWKKKK